MDFYLLLYDMALLRSACCLGLQPYTTLKEFVNYSNAASFVFGVRNIAY